MRHALSCENEQEGSRYKGSIGKVGPQGEVGQLRIESGLGDLLCTEKSGLTR